MAFDVRGAGESTVPAGKADYRFPQLVSDIGAVIDSLGVGRVHLLAHDWGSIQSLGRRHRRDGDEQGRVVHLDLRAAPELRGQVLAVSAQSAWPGRRGQTVPGIGIHLVLLDPGPAGVDGPGRGGRETR